MRKAIAFSLLFLFLVVSLKLPASDFLSSKEVYLRHYENDFFQVIFGELFKEPFEILVLFFKKGKGNPLGITTQDSNTIAVDANELQYILAQRGLKIEDIVLTVHNHPNPSRPSFADHRMHHALKRLGFKGPSFVYYPHTGELIPIE